MGGEADGEQETFTRNRRARGSCEGGRGERGIWDEKLYPFWGHSFLFFFVFSSYLANDNSSHVKR